MADDYSGNVMTTGTVAAGGVTAGTIETTLDTDWFRVSLSAGHNYLIDVRGSSSGGGTLVDPELRFYNQVSTLLTSDDNSGIVLDAQLAIHSTMSTDYFVEVRANPSSGGTGTYNVYLRDLGTSSSHFEAPHAGLNNVFTYSGGWTSQDLYPRELGQVDVNDTRDIVGFGYNGVYVSYATWGGNFQSPAFALQQFGYAQGWTDQDQFQRQLAHVDLGSTDDIVGFGYAGTYVALGTGSGFAATNFGISQFGYNQGWTSQDLLPRQVADVNGDGRADIVGFGYAGTYVSLGIGDGTFAPANLVLNQFGYNQNWTSQDQFQRELADVNGDHMADIVAFGYAGTYVSLATGNGNFAAPTLVLQQFGYNQGWTSDNIYHRELADVNGDGKADIVGFGYAGTYVSLATANGNFAAPVLDLGAYGYGNGWTSEDQYPRELADVTGDGKADIVAFGYNSVYTSAYHDFINV